ncbi:MAG TPA: metallophosphoesterase, partial [Gemmataceae bacterium]
MNRRDALKTFGAVTAGGAVSALAGWACAQRSVQHPPRRKALRVAHLTDVHIAPEGPSQAGMATCLRQIQAHGRRPDLILNGGDAIQDGGAADAARMRAQWKVWQSVLRDDCRLPIEHCLGNHDLWGKRNSEPLHGKEWAMDEFGLAERYRSFDRAGWHFVVLDSVSSQENGYKARLDEEQFEWLRTDLDATAKTTPVLVLSHIPIVAACALFDGENEKSGNWVVPSAWMHIDARRIRDLFLQHPNVKLCLSGHIHLQDRVEYNGVTYVCNGAVSGNWWRGAYQGCAPGYG